MRNSHAMATYRALFDVLSVNSGVFRVCGTHNLINKTGFFPCHRFEMSTIFKNIIEESKYNLLGKAESTALL